MYDCVFARKPRDISLKMRVYQDLSFLWCSVATQLSGRTVSSVSRPVSNGSKPGAGYYFN
jgi:hypothetical protein